MSDHIYGKDLKPGDLFQIVPNWNTIYKLLVTPYPAQEVTKGWCIEADRPDDDKRAGWIEHDRKVTLVKRAEHENSNV